MIILGMSLEYLEWDQRLEIEVFQQANTRIVEIKVR